MTGPGKPPEPTEGTALQPREEQPDELGPEPGVSEDELMKAATSFDQKQLAFTLANQVRQITMIRRAAAAIASTGWGHAITPVARAAVARYCLEVGCDPVRHVFVLGGTVYFNAEFYRELCATNPDFQADDVVFIHHDARATDADNAKRKELRVQYGVPEEAKGAALVTLHYKDRGPFIGVNWAGTGKRSPKYPDKFQDPVGEEEPTKTAHSRAYRKAAYKAEPTWFRMHPKLKGVEEIVVEARTEAPPAEGSVPDATGDDQKPTELNARVRRGG